MRTIICRFQNQEELLNHLRQPTAQSAPDMVTFLTGFQTQLGDPLKAIVVVENVQEQCSIRITPTKQLPSTGQEDMWATTSQIHAQDQIWLQMFLSKLQMLNHFSDAIAA